MVQKKYETKEEAYEVMKERVKKAYKDKASANQEAFDEIVQEYKDHPLLTKSKFAKSKGHVTIKELSLSDFATILERTQTPRSS